MKEHEKKAYLIAQGCNAVDKYGVPEPETLAAMQEFSDQQNAELRERVKELEAYKEYEMTFGSHLLCRIKVSAKGIEVIGAVNGWGDAISSDEIKIQTLKK